MANLAVGFDILGLCVGHLYDTVTLKKTTSKNIVITKIEGDAGKLSYEANKNTATVPLLSMQQDLALDFGFEVILKKNIPLSSGLGGSAASAVAAVVAANQFLPQPLTMDQLIYYATIGEALASGSRHADNVAPGIMGGAVFCLAQNQFVKLNWPQDLHFLLIHPQQELETKRARAVLPNSIPLKQVIDQARYLTSFVLGLSASNARQVEESLQDIYILPARKSLIDCFAELEPIAQAFGGTPLHISGAGPTLFKMACDLKQLDLMQQKIESLKLHHKYGLKFYRGQGSAQGANIISKE
jgi:homoserine kinase